MPWAAPFHSVGARLLREHAGAIGLDPAFGILDRGDAADLIDAIRHELGFSATKKRFPRKEACLAIHSLQANTGWPLDRVLQGWPWCADWRAELETLFAQYARRKRDNAVLDYDDLLLEWERAMDVPEVSARLRARFDQVLVDEFQDTNALQARILRALKPDGQGLTVVGDSGDGPSGGAAGDSTAVLRALIAAGADRAPRLSYLPLVDPPAARAAAAAGPGATVLLRVGHHFSTADGSPIMITGRVQALTDGDYVMRDAGAEGTVAHMGLSAVIAIGSIRLALRSVPGLEWDSGIYRSVGLDPTAAALVFVKSPSHFRASYAPIADRILIADTPGPTCTNLRKVPFRRIRRPMHPLDAI